MSQPCAIQGCKRVSCALCHCCEENICIAHLNEHHNLLNSQLNPLVDEINTLSLRLQTFDIQSRTTNGREKLERWRTDSHEKIDLFYQQKCQELTTLLEQKIEKQQQEITVVQTKLAELVRDQDASHLTISTLRTEIDRLEKQTKNLEDSSICASVQPLHIDVNSIQLYEGNLHIIDLTKLQPTCTKINRAGKTARALASNNRYLLFHDAPNLCLMDRDLTLVKQILWHHGNILDMCWSSTLDRFILVEANNLYTVNDETMSIEILELNRKEKWMACTCSQTSIFLSNRVHGSSVVEYSLLPSRSLIREWTSPKSCSHDEDISSIIYTNETLALLIKNELNKTKRMELKSSVTFDCIWTLQLEKEFISKTTLRFCSLTNDEWLIPNHEKFHLIHVSKHGTIKTIIPYPEIPWFANIFASNVLVISAKNYELHFHKIQTDT